MASWSDWIASNKKDKRLLSALREYVHLEKSKRYAGKAQRNRPVNRDITFQLGITKCRSEEHHRVVIFRDFEGVEIRVEGSNGPLDPKVYP